MDGVLGLSAGSLRAMAREVAGIDAGPVPFASKEESPNDMTASDQDPLGVVGSTIAEKYRVDQFVAEGGFSVLYRAEHKIWKQPCALKFLKVLASAPPSQREQLLQGFVQEGSLLRELSSRTASILQAHDVGTWNSPSGEWYPYLVLEWLEGSPLDAVLAQEKAEGAPVWRLDEIVRLLEPAAKALEVVHRKGVAHRDIKPANLFVIGDARTEDAFIKVLDFGIAKVISDMAELSAAKAQTGAGLTSFTPWYGAPEQFSRKYGATGPWTDVFALALVMVEMMTHRPALEGDEIPELAMESTNKDHRPTPRTKGVEVSDAVEAVFRKAFSVQTTDRYSTAGEFWNALREAMGTAKMTMGPLSGGRLSGAELSAPTVMAPPSGRMPGSTTDPSVGSVRTGSTGGGKGGLIAGIAAVAIAGAAAAFFLTQKKGPDPSTLTPASSGAALPSAVAPAASSAAPVAECPSDMVKIPGGTFFMGLDSEIALPMEKPQHKVTLAPFCIDRDETTVQEYRACSDEGKCPRAPNTVAWPGISAHDKKVYGPLCNIDDAGRDRHPINCVDWEMSLNYCKQRGGRLPTSAEWEFAVRGPDGRLYPWGDDPPDANHLNACGVECLKWGAEHGERLTAMHKEDDGFPTTAPVGSFPKGRSRYGLDDVIGNVMEWVQDWDGAYGKDAEENPTGPATGTERVIRGGAWNAGDMVWVRPSFRFKFPPETRSHGIGFRCVKPIAR
jgi:eukaryotic-like serine/threonine-protein kinase